MSFAFLSETTPLLNALRELLRQEQSLLASEINANDLEALAVSKATIITKLSDAYSQHKPDLDALSDTPELQAWKTLTEDCHKLNAINGRVISVNLTTRTKILNILQGIDTTPPTYDASGALNPKRVIRAHVKA